MFTPQSMYRWACLGRTSLIFFLLGLGAVSHLRAAEPSDLPLLPVQMQADTTRDTVFTCDPLAVGEQIDTLVSSSGGDSLLITTTLLRPVPLLQLGTDLEGEMVEDFFGFSTSLSADGNRLAVGAPRNDDNGNNAGQVRIYDWNGSSWDQLGSDLTGKAPVNLFGQSVSLSADGSRLAVGAPLNEYNGGDAGQVQIYDWDGNMWTQVGLDLNGEAGGDQFGVSVALSADGNQLAVGAPSNDGSVIGSNVGQVRVYQWNGNSWNQLGAEINGTGGGNSFGFSVSLSSDGTRFAAGAPFAFGGGNFDAGYVRIYEWNGNQWTQIGADLDGEWLGINSGWSVCLSGEGNRLAIGAPRVDGFGGIANGGRVQIYEWNGISWTQMGGDLYGEATNDESGWSVSLSHHGNRLAVGAPSNDGSFFNFNSAAGHARIYEWDGGGWTQVGIDLDGEMANDEAGWSVSLSADGGRVAIGGPFNDGNGTNAGHVRVYKIPVPDTLIEDNFICDPAGVSFDTTLYASNSGVCDSLVIRRTLLVTSDTLFEDTFTCDPAEVQADTTFYTNNLGCDSLIIRRTLLRPVPLSQVGANINGEAAGDLSGQSVSLARHGTRLAIGAPRNDGNGSDAGQVRVYQWDGSSWGQLGDDIEGGSAGDQLGYAISLAEDGDHLAVGAPKQGAGYVRIYRWDGSQWTQVGNDMVGRSAGDNFGFAVSLSADGARIAIGAPFNGLGGPLSGHVRIYQWDSSSWVPMGFDIIGGDFNYEAGFSVSLSADGERVALGARGADVQGQDAGQVQVYDWDGSNWTVAGNFLRGEAAFDEFGYAVSLSADGHHLAAGSIRNSGAVQEAGHVRVYRWDDSTWLQLGDDIDGQGFGDNFGTSISLRADGHRVAIGAPYGDPNDSVDAGMVRVYDWDGSHWVPTEDDLSGEAPGDRFGISVALSPDGSHLAMGAFNSEGGAANLGAGHAEVYGPAPVDTLSQMIQVCDSTLPATDTILFASLSGNCDSLVITTYVDTCSNVALTTSSASLGFSAAPNPFEAEVHLLLNLPNATAFTLSIYDAKGRLVQQWQPNQLVGKLQLNWNRRDLPAGLYVARLSGPSIIRTLKLIKR